KKEIPQNNYVMHTAHCARRITLCPVCKEPVPKNQFEQHKAKHKTGFHNVNEKIDFPKQISKPSNRPLPVRETVRNVSSSLAATSISSNSASMRNSQGYRNNTFAETKERKSSRTSPPFTLKDPPPSRQKE
ncbi:hypothetical protein Trydic_g19874, partial [Trypoxylus dichotomus]